MGEPSISNTATQSSYGPASLKSGSAAAYASANVLTFASPPISFCGTAAAGDAASAGPHVSIHRASRPVCIQRRSMNRGHCGRSLVARDSYGVSPDRSIHAVSLRCGNNPSPAAGLPPRSVRAVQIAHRASSFLETDCPCVIPCSNPHLDEGIYV
jgi:hypothetical protein